MKTTFEELQTFVAVNDCGSLTAAARQLGQTASGVSRTLARLEAKLGSTLLHRTTRRIALTEEGAAFLGDARGVLAALAAAEEAAALRRDRPAGRLRVSAASPFMLHVVVPLVPGFRAAYPQVELELSSDDAIIDLLERRTDVALRIGPLRDSSLHARPLGTSALRVLASPDYLARHGTPADPAALARHALLGFTQPATLNTWPLRHAGGDGLAIRPTLAASSGETLRQLALAGVGIACLADFMTAADRAAGTLVEVLPEATLPARQAIHAVYYRNTGVAARIGCFLDHLAHHLGDAPPRTPGPRAAE
ncbi:LysR substrate-binding domain-containing protein [Coralloluteibacterium thermophilus]|uniref:LysR substrate-binding domain-containing protein n=1 Tax=Coralloluteibacterium thermophilum TaxID=2707049 RepID=A0ABV9NPF4_9GAMM